MTHSPTTRFDPRTLIAVAAAFVTYYCMYAFRKPFTVLDFEGSWLGGQTALKTAIVVSQLLGYTTAKFLGTRFCSGLHREKIFGALVGCIVSAMLSLVALPLLPGAWAVTALFWNGISLGMVFGMVMRPLEGRGNSEFLLAGLSCSFIIASGDVKSAGKNVLKSDWFAQTFGGNELWMPLATCALYFIPFLIAAFILSKTPLPSDADIAERSDRHAMDRKDRLAFVKNLAGILIPLAISYFLLTAFRDYRDNFQQDLLREAGATVKAGVFSAIERKVAITVLIVCSLLILIRSHLTALRVSLIFMALGLVLPASLIIMRNQGWISALDWMTYIGVGAYLCYILVHCILFERLVALTRAKGNSVFAMMLFDGLGYIGPILLIGFGDKIGGESRLATFDAFTWVLAIFGGAALIYTNLILKKYTAKKAEENTAAAAAANTHAASTQTS
ncbi:hypothetical protein Rhal01_02887 [Rubritalea halochordaticola]|uniref:MFS transporter n=1 Tax=Rubritalea halochordaticola TaxID=714537 RepID=A0ABP9V7U3_9BACT